MSAVATLTYISPAEYLAIGRAADYKSEYYDGEMVAMSGASRHHERIVVNLTGQIYAMLRGKSCEAYGSNLRIRTPGAPQSMEVRRLRPPRHIERSNYLYPDLTIVCGESAFADGTYNDTLLNPTVIFEILSDSTERKDRGVKWRVYQQIESVQHYVLISQIEPLVEVFTRHDSDWRFHAASELSESVELTAVDVTVALSDLYGNLPFEMELDGDDDPEPT